MVPRSAVAKQVDVGMVMPRSACDDKPESRKALARSEGQDGLFYPPHDWVIWLVCGEKLPHEWLMMWLISLETGVGGEVIWLETAIRRRHDGAFACQLDQSIKTHSNWST